jgi:5-methylcytosine-specific restriction protein B
VHFPDACARLRDSSFAKGFQQGMLSPILNSLDPAHYLIMNGKSRKVMNYFADANFGEGIDEYPKANEALKQVIKVLEPHFQLPPDAQMPVEDVFDAFCHWMVAIRKHPIRHTRYWKIAPGEDAWNWENRLREGYIAIGWDDFGDVSKMDRKDFLRKAEELIAAKPKWNKVGLEQVWKFSRIKEGDVIIANKGTSEILGIGTVSGDYYFVPGEEHGHRLCVLWDDTRPRKISEGGWRRTLIELDRVKLEELLALPPNVRQAVLSALGHSSSWGSCGIHQPEPCMTRRRLNSRSSWRSPSSSFSFKLESSFPKACEWSWKRSPACFPGLRRTISVMEAPGTITGEHCTQ